jgi:hypothetical protein
MKKPFVLGTAMVLVTACTVVLGATMGNMEKLYTDPPNAKRFRIGYVLDKSSIRKSGDDTYEVKMSAVTKERNAVLRLMIDCKKKRVAYGCCETYDSDFVRLLAKSQECETGFSPFRTPTGDMKEVVRTFCEKHGNRDE